MRKNHMIGFAQMIRVAETPFSPVVERIPRRDALAEATSRGDAGSNPAGATSIQLRALPDMGSSK